MKVVLPSVLVLALMASFDASSDVSSSEESELVKAYGSEEFINIATGTRKPISRAPAVASVITAQDIKNMGAVDLDDALESVPGLHVSRSARSYLPIYTFRGIYTENNPQVLVLINGIPITNVYVGDRSQVWGGMPVEDIGRIEIIRGPGSALYGADAFAGTINIITKTREDINGTDVGARVGSYKMRNGWIQYGGKLLGFDAALSLEALNTDGERKIVESDAQTVLDSFFSTDASYAPGPVNVSRDEIETRLDLSRGDWRVRLGYQGRRNVGTGGGVALALDPAGYANSDRYNADLTYSKAITQYLDLTAQASIFDTSARSNLVLFPPGVFNGVSSFPDGMIGNPYVYERHTRLNISTLYYGFEFHKLRFGAGYNDDDMYKIKETKNFAPDGSSLGSVVDVSNDPTLVFIRPHDRHIYYAFAQDEWTLTKDVEFTAGVRYDHYSDFGATTNPRAALVWQTSADLTTKVLYGRAFRPPSFNELYNINNPVALGNSDLKPEKIDTYELAFSYQNSNRLQTGLNIFQYHMQDILQFVPDPPPATTVTAQNKGERDGYGLELEAKYNVSPTLDILGNYAFQKSKEKETDSDVPNAPQHQIYGRAQWRFSSGWTLNPQVKWVASRKRESTDTRSEVNDYAITDIIVRYQSDVRRWEVAFAARNVFNVDAREPSPAPGAITNDIPLPGRNFFVEARYHLD